MTKKCSICGGEIKNCDSCNDKFEIAQDIKCTQKLGHEHECESCFNDDYEDAEVENE